MLALFLTVVAAALFAQAISDQVRIARLDRASRLIRRFPLTLGRAK